LSRAARLRVVLALNLALVGALVGVGISAHSLGVWAEGADCLADAMAIGIALLALHLARRPATARRPDSYPRATHHAAFVNAGWPFVLSLLVAAGALDRLATGARRVDGLPVLAASGTTAVLMLAGALLLGGDIDECEDVSDEGAALGARAVLLDTAGDAAAAAGVAVAGAAIYIAHGLYWLDPAIALVVAAVVGYHAVRLLARIRASIADSTAPPSACPH
jgi:cobalt-zinc-cadmium efflux system protein